MKEEAGVGNRRSVSECAPCPALLQAVSEAAASPPPFALPDAPE